MGDDGDRHEIEKLRAQLEKERFDSLRELIETRFRAVIEKLDEYSARLDEHIKTPHAAVAPAVATIPQGTPGEEQVFWRLLARNWRIVAAVLGITTLGGGGGYVMRGCGPLDGREIHLHPKATASTTPSLAPGSALLGPR